MLAIQAVLEYFSLRVQLVQDGVCVGLMARREDNDFELSGHFLQEADRVRANIDPGRKLGLLNSEVDLHVGVGALVVDAVDQGLVQVQD